MVHVEAGLFSTTVDSTIIYVFRRSLYTLKHSYEKHLSESHTWDATSTGISIGQYESYLEDLFNEQIRTLACMSFAMMESKLMLFLKRYVPQQIDKQEEPEDCEKAKDASFDRFRKKYKRARSIDFNNLLGFALCKEVVLARNSCIHNDGYPHKHYLEQTEQHFIGDDGRLTLNEETLLLAANGLKSFVNALANALNQSDNKT